jgi:hypothetical protein
MSQQASHGVRHILAGTRIPSRTRRIRSVDQAALKTESTASGGRPTMWAISETV